MNCYKVKVKTTNSMGNKTRGADGKYLECDGGVMWIFGYNLADVERVVDSEHILYAEMVGDGYLAE